MSDTGRIKYKDESAKICIDIHRGNLKGMPELSENHTKITAQVLDRSTGKHSEEVLAEGNCKDILKAFGAINKQYNRTQMYKTGHEKRE